MNGFLCPKCKGTDIEHTIARNTHEPDGGTARCLTCKWEGTREQATNPGWMRMSRIFPAIERERAFQDKKYPGPADLATLIHVMELELAEVKHAIVKEGRVATLREILQVVAVGVRAMEQYGVHERVEKP